ncbi:hypothetical protein R7D97_24490 [Vibrio sp. Vb5031]|uniref:hypothetical protein n=1 Tax=Vibrio TaxID=662 RepID=UPI00072290A1|nr:MULTISPECIES: hypothetical protein [Vibrio]ALR91725.1 hypothetical protein AT730_04700 [Vibrio alginolyticus]ELA8471114.1 hypothetical protein [Vibrio alginolyticus]MBS9976765.1 hypothetical protein [Vibrio alginolyticus]MBT0022931.1 hypothetical protein [Vibrio alginolyticus]MBY7710518.1 hypothetical protein [Vibrio alginolyticus]
MKQEQKMNEKVTEFPNSTDAELNQESQEPQESQESEESQDAKEVLDESSRRIAYSFDHEKYELERKERSKRMYIMLTFFSAFSIFMFAAFVNKEAFILDAETAVIINQAINAVVLLVIPFLLGSVGGLTRILMSDVVVDHRGTLVVSSGLMAMFSWIGIKSGVLLAIVAPHLEKQGVVANVEGTTSSGFYTMALVAIAVGMFSTNLYLFINSRVEQLAFRANNGGN